MLPYIFQTSRVEVEEVIHHFRNSTYHLETLSVGFFCLNRRKKKGHTNGSAKAQKTGWWKTTYSFILSLRKDLLIKITIMSVATLVWKKEIRSIVFKLTHL